MELNKIYNEDCIQTMVKMSDNFIDLTITSPPYDNMRNFIGSEISATSIDAGNMSRKQAEVKVLGE
jgi:site-specific DNA-methyltransferase (adenine-specific)